LTNFSFHATQKTKDKRKGFEPKLLKTLLFIVFCCPLAPLRQGRTGVWGLRRPCHPAIEHGVRHPGSEANRDRPA